jgi:hypothetical protein
MGRKSKENELGSFIFLFGANRKYLYFCRPFGEKEHWGSTE